MYACIMLYTDIKVERKGKRRRDEHFYSRFRRTWWEVRRSIRAGVTFFPLKSRKEKLKDAASFPQPNRCAEEPIDRDSIFIYTQKNFLLLNLNFIIIRISYIRINNNGKFIKLKIAVISLSFIFELNKSRNLVDSYNNHGYKIYRL